MKLNQNYRPKKLRLSDAAVTARQSFMVVFAFLGMLAGGYLLADRAARSVDSSPAMVEPAVDAANPTPGIWAAESPADPH